MKHIAALAVACAFVLTAGQAQAHSTFSARALSDHHVGRSQPELVAQRAFSVRVVRRLAGSWRVAPRHSTCWSHVPWSHVCDRSRRRLLAHRWLAALAARRLAALYPPVVAPAPWLVGAFTCIHGGEGAWTANTGNGYYGGLQMDLTFQSEYGADFVRRWGTADHWPAWAQMAAAERAYTSGRGFSPWPNTARACGLL